MLYKKGYFDMNIALWVGGIFFLGYSIPLISLHINYYLRNRNDVFEYNKSTGKATYQSGDKKIEFEEKDIEYSIYNLLGERIISGQLPVNDNLTKIELSGLIPGTYIIRVQTAKNGFVCQKFQKI